jgi:divalent metal cation (Fe/Co/Zn/Cd) transporter
MLMGIVALTIKSIWFGIFSIYYLILSIMRGGVLWSKKKRIKNEENSYLAVAIALIVLTLATVAIVILTYNGEDVSRFEGLLIYCSAAYTFYKLCLSIYNIIKAKKQESLLVEAVKDISFVDAIVSIFVLQVSMLHVFSQNLENVFVPLNALTGSLVCMGILAVSFLMILKYIKIKKSKKQIIKQDKVL